MVERKTIWRLFFVWNYEKAERWLNEMAMSGWVLVRVTWPGRFTFEACEPGEYIIRTEMNNNESYVSFLEETGAEFIGRCLRWVYFRKKSELGPFDLFSDIDSKLSHLKRIETLLRIMSIMLLVSGLMNMFIAGTNNSSYDIFNDFVSASNLLVCALMMYGLGRIQGKKEDLERDRLLHE